MNNEDHAVVKNYLQESFEEMKTELDRITVFSGSEIYIENLRTTLDDAWGAICMLVGPYPEADVPLVATAPAVGLPPAVHVGCGRVREC